MQLIVELHCGFFCLSLFQVVLPQRKFQLHHLKLSEDEETVYSVLFARSRYVQWRSTFSQLLFYSCSCLGLNQGSSNCSYGIIDKLDICGPFCRSSLVLSPRPQLTFASYTQWACSLAFLHGRSRLCTLSPGLPGRCGAVLGKYWPTWYISLTFDLLSSLSPELLRSCSSNLPKWLRFFLFVDLIYINKHFNINVS